jgi:hypothetical protein
VAELRVLGQHLAELQSDERSAPGRATSQWQRREGGREHRRADIQQVRMLGRDPDTRLHKPSRQTQTVAWPGPGTQRNDEAPQRHPGGRGLHACMCWI